MPYRYNNIGVWEKITIPLSNIGDYKLRRHSNRKQPPFLVKDVNGGGVNKVSLVIIETSLIISLLI